MMRDIMKAGHNNVNLWPVLSVTAPPRRTNIISSFRSTQCPYIALCLEEIVEFIVVVKDF